MKYKNLREEELKNRVGDDFFGKFQNSGILGNIDFAVSPKDGLFKDEIFFLWAEAKRGNKEDIYESFVQLVLTIGQARVHEKLQPPAFLGVFDAEKIAFIPYNKIHEVFYQNDFNWNVTPSDHQTKEFQQLYGKIKKIIENDIPWETYLFDYKKDEKELHRFIKNNFVLGKLGTTKIEITENNFVHIFYKWLEAVKPKIAVKWETEAYKYKVYERDFYLADLISENDETIEKLLVQLRKTYYKTEVDLRNEFFKEIRFTDGGEAYRSFWAKYHRPPKEIFRQEIRNRQDLLVLPNFRERNGAFFTPPQWVELSQQYLAEALGETWQDEYYVWDCAAGTGNLLNGLTRPYRIFASTLDSGDVKIMHEDIDNRRSILLREHVFQFDFLNDDFSQLPDALQKIIADPEKRKKLVIYINPPYKEASNKKTLEGGIEGNRGVEQSKINKKYASLLGQGNAELFAQFFTRIYCEIPGVVLAEFSKLKILQGQHFINFRSFFHAKLEKMFVCPANSFENVGGQFPIGFMIWDTNKKEPFESIVAEIFEKDGTYRGIKGFYTLTDSQYINDWIKPFRGNKDDMIIAKFPFKGNDFQNQNMIAIVNPENPYNVEAGQFLINANNLIVASVYFAVRKVIPADWLNDRDQFLYPNDGWKTDLEFQNDCLAYTLFNNNIQSKFGVNHWIPFIEYEVAAYTLFDSNFMTDFFDGKISHNNMVSEPLLFYGMDDEKGGGGANYDKAIKREFSETAKNVFRAGKELWKYYHAQPNCNVNASLYDIREYFQGRNDKGKMNNKSGDETYNKLIGALRDRLKILAKKIEPKVYEYGFLKK